MDTKQILIVENEPVRALYLKNILKKLDYYPAGIVTTGAVAVEQAEGLKPDMVLMDLDGDFDGIKSADLIRKKYSIPVVFLTINSDFNTTHAAKSTEPHEYILKPFNVRELQITLEMAFFKHQMEQQQREHQKWTTTILGAIGDGVITTNLDLCVAFMNPAAEKMCGRDAADVKGKPLADIFSLKDTVCGDPIELPTPQALETGKTLQIETAILCKPSENRSIFIETDIRPLKDADGITKGVVLTFRNITARMEVEQQLSCTEKCMTAIIDNATEGIYRTTPEGRFLLANSAMASLLGYSSPEALITHIQDIGTQLYQSPDGRKRLLETLQQNGFVKDYELAFKRADGTYLWVNVNARAVNDEKGKLIYVEGFMHDISKRREARDSLKAAHEEIKSLLSAFTSIFIGINHQNMVRQWNSTAETILGLKEADVMNKCLMDCSLSWEWGKVQTAMATCRQIGQTICIHDLRYITSDGKTGFLELVLNPVTDNNKSVNGILIVGKDITQYKIMESQLIQAQKLESIGQLAAGIAHEINTPTQYVSDNVLFLEESFRDILALLEHYHILSKLLYTHQDPSNVLSDLENMIQEMDIQFLKNEIPKALDQSREGLQQVAKIVRSMKEFAHPGAVQKIPLDINHAILNTITVCRNEWKYVAEMVTELEENLPMVSCLPGEFNQAILNVIINAAQAIGDVVGNGSPTKGKITVKTSLNKDMVEIRIADSGPGIAPEHQNRIFDPFFTTKEVGKGTGQGLPIVHGIIVRKHNGRLDFETETGKGTTFIIGLPLDVSSTG